MGTRMTPIFKYLKEDMKPIDKPDLLIIFTDGYIESHIEDIYRPSSNTKLMWVLTGNKKDLNCDNPWTTKIKELKITDK